MAKGEVAVPIEGVDVRPQPAEVSGKRMRIVGAVLVGLAIACVAMSSPEHLHRTFLGESGSTEQMISELAAREVNTKVAQLAAQGLPPMAGLVAQSLASNSSFKVDCSRKAAYVLLRNSFATIAGNASAENATIYALDAKKYKTSQDAHDLWLSAGAKFRSAETAHTQAVSAFDFANYQYNQYMRASSTAEQEWNEQKPKYDVESDQLKAELPVLTELISILESPGELKVHNMQELDQVMDNRVKDKIAALSSPAGTKLAAQFAVLKKTMLEGSDASNAMAAALTIVRSLITTMEGRVQEIANTVALMQGDKDSNAANVKVWEEKTVKLGDAKDKALNTKNEESLVMEQYEGQYKVAQAAYDDYHSGFLDTSARFARELRAIAAIDAKLAEAIAQC